MLPWIFENKLPRPSFLSRDLNLTLVLHINGENDILIIVILYVATFSEIEGYLYEDTSMNIGV